MMAFLLVVISFAATEGVAWLSHKFIMHGWLWTLHRDHHQKEGGGVLEKNDLFFAFFSIPGVVLIFLGAVQGITMPFLWMGLGITVYGLAYFIVHDIFIHQRIKIFRKSDNFYLRAIRKAHKMHHKHLDRSGGECFGMLWVPLKYFREALKSAE